LVHSFKNLNFGESENLWNDLLAKSESSIFLTHKWQNIWWKIFGGSYESKIVLLENDEHILGIAPMMQRGATLSFIGNSDLFDYHDFIINHSQDSDTFYDGLINAIKNENWTTLDLSSIKENSLTLDYLPERLQGIGCTVHVEIEDVVPGLNLPSVWEEYLGNLRKKDRHELRRKLRRLDSAGEYNLVTTTNETLEGDIVTFLDMMAESKEDKRDFMDPQRVIFFQTVISEMLDEGLAKLFFLEIGSRKVASALCFDLGASRFLYNSGYRIEESQYSVSLLLKALTINDAIEKQMGYYDFLRGNEQYKFHLGAEEINLMRLVASR